MEVEWQQVRSWKPSSAPGCHAIKNNGMERTSAPKRLALRSSFSKRSSSAVLSGISQSASFLTSCSQRSLFGDHDFL
jgi:hypothetical protein